MRSIKQWVRQTLEAKGYIVFNSRKHELYAHDGLCTLHSSHFINNPSFQESYQRGVRASQGVDSRIEWRLHVALWAAKSAMSVPGDFVECGVNAGFMSSAIMHHLEWQRLNRTFFLIDTFCGPMLSQYSAEEVQGGRREIAEQALAKGAYVTDFERVLANFSEWSNAKVVRGIVPDVLHQLKFDQVAFLHLDMNCAYPERSAFEYFWEKISPGGIVLLDDYAAYGYDQTAKAIDAAADGFGANVLALPTGQGLVWKRTDSAG